MPEMEPREKHLPSNPPRIQVSGPKGALDFPIFPYIKLQCYNQEGKVLPASVIDTRVSAEVKESTPDSLMTIENMAKSDRTITLSVEHPEWKRQREMWGTTRAMIANAIHGVASGWTLTLRIVGIGYRASLEPDRPGVICMKIGYANIVQIRIPEGIEVSVPNPNRIRLSGIDWAKVTSFAAAIRRLRKPEPYNQKGIFVGDETIAKKEGKKR